MTVRRIENFYIEQIEPQELTQPELLQRAEMVQAVLFRAWKIKFVPGVLTQRDLKSKIMFNDAAMVEEQAVRIMYPQREARYWLSYGSNQNYQSPTYFNTAGFLRIELYSPRRPWQRPYPNITDLEVIDGKMHGRYEKQAAALLSLALANYEPAVQVSMYIVDEDHSAKEWLTDIGFQLHAKPSPSETVGDSVVHYRHLQAPSIEGVQRRLVAEYPFLSDDI